LDQFIKALPINFVKIACCSQWHIAFEAGLEHTIEIRRLTLSINSIER